MENRVMPGQAAFLAREQLRRAIDAEIARAIKHGITAGAGVGRKMPFEVITDAADVYAQAAAAAGQPQPEPVMAPAVARPLFGSTLVLAIHPGQDDEMARKGEEAIRAATAGEGVTVVTVRGIEALRTWEPPAAMQPAPELADPVTVEGVLCRDYPAVVAAMQAAGDRRQVVLLRVTDERDQLREQLAIATVALRDIKDTCDAGTFCHDTAHGALDDIGGVEPSPPGEAGQLRERLGLIEDAIGNLAAGLKLSADSSRPSKKSEIEDSCAAAVYGLLRIDGESGEETRQRIDRQRAGLEGK